MHGQSFHKQATSFHFNRSFATAVETLPPFASSSYPPAAKPSNHKIEYHYSLQFQGFLLIFAQKMSSGSLGGITGY